MKKTIHVLPVFALAAALLTSTVSAQLNVPSDGSDGVLNITSNTVIDLSQAVSGTWSSASSGHGIYDPNQWAIVLKYASVTIANGATVTFVNHYANPPVIWLVQGNVTINGTVSVNGNNGVNTSPGAFLLTTPGPGGFRGGAANSAIGYGDGLGPGGGVASAYYGAAYGSYQSSYGNPQILPLIGGSGGSYIDRCNPGGSGGAGAGAILIAAGGTITVNGQITATPGTGTDNGCFADAGAGGAIRLVANQIAGSGTITATPQGRTRMEANSMSQQLTITPNAALVSPGPTPIIFPPTSAPSVSIVSVGGQPAPSDPAANVTSSPDIGIQTNSPVTVVLQTVNFPTSGSVTVRVVPVYGPSSTLTATLASGNVNSATWQLTSQIPLGYCVLQAHATAQ
jgi:hypothetical protein